MTEVEKSSVKKFHDAKMVYFIGKFVYKKAT